MQNIRLNAKAAYELMERLRDVLDNNEDETIREVQIRAGDDIKTPLNEVEVHVSLVAVCTGPSAPARAD